MGIRICVGMFVCVSTFSNIFSSEAIGLIEAKFHVEPPWDGGTIVCSNGSGHMTDSSGHMIIWPVAMPIYGKNLKKSSPETKGR